MRPAPLIPDDLRFGLHERVNASGEILESLDKRELATLVKRLRNANVESVAICLLFSFAAPMHEEQIARALSSLKIPLSISHQILPEYREFEELQR